MPKTKIEVDGYKCTRCGHTWVSRGKRKSVTCPNCRSPYWDIPKKEETEEQKTE